MTTAFWFAVLGSAAQRHWALLHIPLDIHKIWLQLLEEEMFQQASVAGFSPGLVQGNLLPDGDGLWLLQNQLTDKFLRLLLPARSKAPDEVSENDGAALFSGRCREGRR